MQSIEIDSELNRLALAEAAQQYPEFAEHALRVVARPLSRGFAWQLEWKGEPPLGQQAWEFQNRAIRAYKRLARNGTGAPAGLVPRAKDEGFELKPCSDIERAYTFGT